MSKVKTILALFSVLILVQGLQAQKREPEDTVELMNQIRREKFDSILPQVMRENKVDMWIHVIRPWIPDPLAYEFGSDSGIFVFTDRGGERIERAVFNSEVQDPGVFDIIKGRADALDLQNYYVPKDPEKGIETELDYRFKGLGEFVAERDPQRIAVNYSEKLALAEGSEVRPLTDGLSHTDYIQLTKALGVRYANRMVSAEYLIIDYLSRRVKKEVELNHLMGLKATKYLERELDKIVPGVTTLGELAQNVFVRDPDGNEHNNDDYVIQRGDLIGILYGAGDMRRIMDADVGGIGYVLREGETDLPPEIQKIWDESAEIREILRKNIKPGRTARETLNLLIRKLEEAGYVYIDKDEYDRKADPEKTQVHLDLHAMGKGMLGPRISPFGPKWQGDMKIPINHCFAFEFMVHMPVPKWGKGKHLYVCFHDGGVVTEHGAEYNYPPCQRIRIIK